MLGSDDELSPLRDSFLKNFLEEERSRWVGEFETHKDELRFLVSTRKSELADDIKLHRLFENYLATLPTAERPQTKPQEHRPLHRMGKGPKAGALMDGGRNWPTLNPDLSTDN